MSVKAKERQKGGSEKDPEKTKDSSLLTEEKESAKEKSEKSSVKKSSQKRNQRRASRRFTKNRVHAVGSDQGSRYLALAIFGLFFPPFAPAAWLLSQSLRSLAKQDDFLLDNKVYAAWVIGVVATIFYASFTLLVASLYLFFPGYSLV